MASRVPLEGGSPEYQQGSRINYPNPFFSLSTNFIPSNIKTLFKYCRGFFYSNGFIRNIVTKLTEYPMTDILYKTKLDADTKEKFDKAFYDHLKIKQLLIEIGLDYYTFGNAFLSANLRFKRYLKCMTCGEEHQIEKVNFKFKKFNFTGVCPKCQAMNEAFKIIDEPIKSIQSFNFIRWAPEQIDIDYDELTGEAIYYYKISTTRKKQIIAGKKETVMKTPALFLQALKENKSIKLDKNNFYHFKRPTLAEENQAWGKPVILPALKDIYYMQTLQRGNEAVAHEHIVPKKAIFPAATGTLDPYSSMNLGKWRGQLEEQVLKWKKDPNHIGIFPIPIGYQQLGGDAKILLLSPELKLLEDNIIINMGLTLDFIRGGASWTGSSISLRIIENHFMPYREMLTHFLNYFVIRKLKDILGYPEIVVGLQELKMTDDTEAKQLLLNMRATKEISRKTMYDKFGIDAEQEQKNLMEENKADIDLQKSQNITMAMAQGMATEVLARYEARAQHAIQDETHRIREEQFTKDVLQENKNTYMDSSKLIENLAIQISLAAPEKQEALFNNLAKRAPITAGLVLERFLAAQAPLEEEGETGATGQGAGAPTKPNKKENQIKPKSSKQKGQTRGNV